MCQPGRPLPHGESQEISPGFACFHKAKSNGSSFAAVLPLYADLLRLPVHRWIGHLISHNFQIYGTVIHIT